MKSLGSVYFALILDNSNLRVIVILCILTLTYIKLRIKGMDIQKMPQLLTLKEVCEILNCHPNTLRKWDKEGRLKAIRFGSRGDRRYKKADILTFIEQQS